MGYIERKGRPGRIVLLVLLYMSFLWALPGCSQLWKARESIVVQHDTTVVHHRDSIHQRDSIYIREWMKGDTVYIDRWHDRTFYRDRWRDSVQIREVHDTTTVEKKVERELTAGQKVKINSFWWLFIGLIASLGWIFRKPIVKLIKTLI